MSTQKFKIINNTGASIRTVGGEYAIGEEKEIDLVDLLVNPYKLEQLNTDIGGGIIIVQYKGSDVTASEIELILDLVAARAIPENPPKLDLLNVTDGGAVAAAGGDIELVGRNLLRGQTFDSIQLIQNLADLTIASLKPGKSPFSVEVIVGGGALSVTIADNKLTIELALGGSTDDEIATAINDDGTDWEGLLRADSAGTGSFTVAIPEAPLTGGVGNYDGNKVMVGGLEALPQNETGTSATAKWSDTELLVTTQAVGGATDVVAIEAEVDGILAPPLSAVLV
jgi:hypothetical protein